MPDENISSAFERLNLSSKVGSGAAATLGKQRFTNNGNDVGEKPQRDPLKVALSNLQLQQGGAGNRAPSMLIRKASMDRMNRIPSTVRKASMDRLNSVNGASGSGGVRKPSVDLHGRQPGVVRKGSLDGLSVNLNPKRVISASTTSFATVKPARKVDIGTYDGSLERDEKRGRRSNDVRGGLLDLDARQ